MSWFRRKRTPSQGPDYSEVDTNEKVQRLVASGELVPLLLLPEAFGGTPIRENTIYVPPYAAELKRDFDQNVIMPLAAERKVTHYRADPEYSGRSRVPIAIKLIATDPGNITYDLTIWGLALDRNVPKEMSDYGS